MQRTAFSPLALLVILLAALLLTAPRAEAVAPAASPGDSAATAETAKAAGEKAAAPETSATFPEASVSRIESITQDGPAPAPEPENAAPEQTIYPGVLNIHLQGGGDGSPKVSLNYPAFRSEAVDADIRACAEGVLRSFEEDVRDGIDPKGEKPDSYGMWDLTGMYSLERPSPKVVSVIFNIFSYTGGAHGNLVIICRNYDLKSGKRLEFADLFKDPEKALTLMSDYARESLTKNLDEEGVEEMIRDGTAPELNNFLALALTPAGVTIHFQPYQVAPWSSGPQQVEMPLAALAAAGPEPAIWPDATKAPKADAAAAGKDGDHK